ncbi:beta-ketoacyl synthase N-terminal-like domain-containing protein [Motilimonas sp. KMU-193]|uniref:beta-ketoacyl synthase N-terminal-like domain-containing protein n=1 Tax=Motilimonas sp. KMU-193 TaxID=3388668 RepID=UPI00396B18C1
MTTNAVYISGFGALTALGSQLTQHTQLHQQGISGLTPHPELPWLQGVVNEPNLKQWIPDKKACRMLTRQGLLGIASATLAIEHAGLTEADFSQADHMTGVIYGAFFSQGVANAAQPYLNAYQDDALDHQAFGERHYRDFPPLWILPRLPNTTGGQISIQYGLRGLSYSVVNGFSGGMIAVGEAFNAIKQQRGYRYVTGASEMDPTLEQLFALDCNGLLARNQPHQAGLVIGEAGVSFIVEASLQAQQRCPTRTEPQIEILAYHNSYIPDVLTLSPSIRQHKIEQHIQACLDKAGVCARDLSAAQLSLAGIDSLDHSEVNAVTTLLGNQALLLSATDYCGFTLGASAATQLFYGCLQLSQGYWAPVLNLEHKPHTQNPNYNHQKRTHQGEQILLCHHLDHQGNEVSLLLKSVAATCQLSQGVKP